MDNETLDENLNGIDGSEEPITSEGQNGTDEKLPQKPIEGEQPPSNPQDEDENNLLTLILSSLQTINAKIDGSETYKEALRTILQGLSDTVSNNATEIQNLKMKVEALGVQLNLVPTSENVLAEFKTLSKTMDAIDSELDGIRTSNTELILAVGKLTADASDVFNKNTQTIVAQLQDHKVFLEQFLTQLQSKSDEYLEMKYEANAALQSADTTLKGIYDSISTINTSIDNMSAASDEYVNTFRDLNEALSRVVSSLSIPNKVFLYTEAVENITTAISNLRPKERTV